MSSEIKERLQTAGEACVKAYAAWDGNEKDEKARETLQDAIHELRKVTSRLEIELAISERDQMGQKKIPIPPHRASRKKVQQQDADDSQPSFNNKNDDNGGDNDGPKKEVKIQRRTRTPRKATGGEG